MNYYPVLIPTLNRYEHFRRCVESLSRCTHAEKTELVIGLDYPPSEKYREGYEKIRAYIPQITGFKKVTCIKREYNYGAVNNSADLTDTYFKIYDAIIYSEDDNEFAPSFLDFMDKALDMYKDEPKVRSVCGYLNECYYQKGTLHTIFTDTSCAWGIGIWREKEKEFAQIPYRYYEDVLHSFKLSMKIFFARPQTLGLLQIMVKQKQIWGDVMRTSYQIINNEYQIRSSMSLVRNWGHDGSGLHCGNDIKIAERYIHQPIAETNNHPISLQTINRSNVVNLYWSDTNNRLIEFKILMMVFIRYIKFRLLKW